MQKQFPQVQSSTLFDCVIVYSVGHTIAHQRASHAIRGALDGIQVGGSNKMKQSCWIKRCRLE